MLRPGTLGLPAWSLGAIRMNRLILALPLLVLAACDPTPEVTAENASIGEVAAKVREAGGGKMLVRPGRWVSDVTLESIDIPGMPPAAAEQIKATMAKAASGHETCLTPEQANRPGEDFFAGKDGNCRYDKFSMDGGKIDGVMRCAAQGSTQVISFNGAYSPDSYDMRMDSKLDTGPNANPMTMAMRIKSRRVGECDPAVAAN